MLSRPFHDFTPFLRAARYETEFIGCRKHPNRRVNRSDWVTCGRRRCASCNNGKPSYSRWTVSDHRKLMDSRRHRYNRIQENKI